MTERDDQNDEDADVRALRKGLRANALSEEALRRIREATLSEWRQNIATVPARKRGRWGVLAVAASLAAAAIIGWWHYPQAPGTDGAVLGQLVRTEAPGVVETHYLRTDQTFGSGATLRGGQSLEVRGDSLVALKAGGNLRLARASAVTIESGARIRLEQGELYVDIPPGTAGNEGFLVMTSAGDFRHMGTQFSIAFANGTTRLRVREGSVSWQASSDESTVEAGTEVIIDRERRVTRRAFPTAGREWSWVESLAPDLEIDNRPVADFLAWFSRETGRKLVFTTDAARQQASDIRMHGNIRGLTAMEALTAVMAATSLRFDLPEGLIRVSFAGETTAPAT